MTTLFQNHQSLNELHNLFSELAHVWDDLVDKDKDVLEKDINRAFLICLIDIPSNSVYRKIIDDIKPLWLSVVSAYTVANEFEKNKNEDLLAISHGLRYAAGHIMTYAVISEMGLEEANKIMQAVWQSIFFEKFDDYKQEHLYKKG